MGTRNGLGDDYFSVADRLVGHAVAAEVLNRVIDELRLRVSRVVVWRDAIGHKRQPVPQDLSPIHLSHHLRWIDEMNSPERWSDRHNARAEATVNEIGLLVSKQECIESALAHRASQQKRVAAQRPDEPNSFETMPQAIGISEMAPQIYLARRKVQLLQPGDYRSHVGFLSGKVRREIERIGDHRNASRSRDEVA